MKQRHAEKLAKMFPSLLGMPGELSSEQEVGSLWNMDETESPEDPLHLRNPSEEKDQMINQQKEQIENRLAEQNSHIVLKEKES